jgi:hypothetical protein
MSQEMVGYEGRGKMKTLNDWRIHRRQYYVNLVCMRTTKAENQSNLDSYD